MANIWVSPTGNDTSNGLSSSSPKKTIQAGYAAATANATLFVMSGLYENVLLTATKALNIVAAGDARLVSTNSANDGGVFLSTPLVGVITTLVGLRFEDYLGIIRDQPVVSSLPQPTSNNLYAKHCTFSRGSVSSQAVFAWALRDRGGGTISVTLENCTLRNWGTLFVAWAQDADANNTRPNRIVVSKARSTLFDTYSKIAEAAVGGGAGANGTARIDFLSGAIDANGYSASVATAASFTQTGPGAGSYGHEGLQADSAPVLSVASPGYTDVSSTPPDLAIRPTTGSALIGTGYRGDSIGSGFWPTQTPSGEGVIGIAVPGTDWTGWVNDQRWFNTISGLPGPDGPATASPAILSTFFTSPFANWVINPDVGGGVSARVLSPVWDFGVVCDFAQVSWESAGSGANRLVSTDQDYTSPSPGPQIEVRFSNTAFNQTDTSPTNWTKVSKKERPNLSGRYWQARVVLRTDGF